MIRTLLLTLLCIGILLWWFWIYTETKSNDWLTQTRSDSTTTICLENQENTCFDLEVARTSVQREYGLMNRTGMNTMSGMIFVFDTDDIYSFWMKNTLIPLDMLRVSSTGQIIDIQTALPCTEDPCPSYTPIGTARYVIELNEGISERFNIVTWSMFYFIDK